MADRPALSLRPGGGNKGGGGRVFGTSGADGPLLRPHVAASPVFAVKDSLFEGRDRVKYTPDQLLKHREAVVSIEDILKIKREIEVELVGEEQQQISAISPFPAYHLEVIKEAISLALDKGLSCIEPVSNLLHYLHTQKVFTSGDIATGCLHYASMLDDDIAIDLPNTPASFGEVMGKAVLASPVDFKLVSEVLKNVEGNFFQKVVLNAAIQTISSSPSGKSVLNSQTADISVCQNLFR